MPILAENQNSSADPNQLRLEPGAPLNPVLGHAGLSGVELSVGNFYGSDEQFIWRTPDGEHRLIVGHETVGLGHDVRTALHDSLEKMRTLETVHTNSLVRMEMTDSASVSFTKLEHYSPKVAPSRGAYPVPSYLDGVLTDGRLGDNTYRNTIAEESWQTKLRSVLAEYLAHDSGGQQLISSLKIRSLSHLTPEQAVKLSAAFVQNVSKYSLADVGLEGPTHADQSTAHELLMEGMANKQDSDWGGNGVCRNVASNVKAVFEALKQTQAKFSMLNNTYCVYGAGIEGTGYADTRTDYNTTQTGDKVGHAWNTFVTVDSRGSTVTTIIDATWALDTDASLAIEHLDQTEKRSAPQLMSLFKESKSKLKAFDELTFYVEKLISTSYKNQRYGKSSEWEGIREYVTTEYLKAAAMLPEIPNNYGLQSLIATSVGELAGKLEPQEIATFFALDKSGYERELIKVTLADYDSKRTVPVSNQDSGDRLVFADDNLQALAYEAVGTERVAQLSETSGSFRARLRELHPELLPIFNATERPADAQELRHFAVQNGVHDRDPKMIMSRLYGTLKRAAGDNGIYNAIVAGRSDYNLAKNFKTIKEALHGVQL